MTHTAAVPKAPPTRLVRFAQRLQRRVSSFAEGMAPPPFALLDLVMARWVSDALGAITQLGIAEALSKGPRTPAVIAAELGLHAESVHRVLRALARRGLLLEGTDGAFALTEITRPLLAEHPSSMRNMVLEVTRPRNVAVWAHLADSIRSGEASWGAVHDVDMWTYLDQHPHEHAIFHGAMVELTREAAPSFARSFDFGRFASVCDVGGGEGQLLATILAVHPELQGVLVDAPKVVARAPDVLDRLGVRERCAIVAADILREVPAGHGVYLAKNILHGLSFELACEALTLWRAAMPADGRLVVIEVVVPESNEPYLQWLDLQMLLVSFGGRERTRSEFAALFAAAGLALETVIETPTPMSMIVARRA